MACGRSNATSCLSAALSLLMWTAGCLSPVLTQLQTGRIAYDVGEDKEFAEIRRYPAHISHFSVVDWTGIGRKARG